ncbi:MAG TPA: TetR/AcrR family transcriptional regulator [Microthrixaceae bacterium]|nr:TetR/AcrR family transcriptional regulator [Microthrixaceae bacterium]
MVRTTGRLLRTQGYNATGLNQIVAEAEAPKGSMYFHFPGGKEELAAASIDRFADRLSRLMERGFDEQPTVADAIGVYLDDLTTTLARSDFAEGCAVAAVTLEAASTHERLARAVDRALTAWTDLIATALEREGRDPATARRLAIVALAAIEGAIVLGKGHRDRAPMDEVQAALRDLLAPA